MNSGKSLKILLFLLFAIKLIVPFFLQNSFQIKISTELKKQYLKLQRGKNN